MAKEKLFFKTFGEIHPKYKTPHKSLIYQAIWASILVISGTFDQLTDMLIFASFIFYGSGAIGLIIMKQKGIITKKIIGYPVIPAVFILFCVVLVSNALYSTTEESLVGLLFLASSIPLYFYLQKKNKTVEK
jgi:APA family basic amino acid/polyamine antiporter